MEDGAGPLRRRSSRTAGNVEIMSNERTREYLRSAVMSASPEQLHLMLYDGAIRFARQGREAMLARDHETACEKLLRAQRIIAEMRNGLRPEIQPALCEQVSALYDFVYWRFVEGNTRHDPKLIDDALQILEHQRETWKILVEKVRHDGTTQEEATDGAASSPSKTDYQPLSVQG
jgi:flagellar protein FliS